MQQRCSHCRVVNFIRSLVTLYIDFSPFNHVVNFFVQSVVSLEVSCYSPVFLCMSGGVVAVLKHGVFFSWRPLFCSLTQDEV